MWPFKKTISIAEQVELNLRKNAELRFSIMKDFFLEDAKKHEDKITISEVFFFDYKTYHQHPIRTIYEMRITYKMAGEDDTYIYVYPINSCNWLLTDRIINEALRDRELEKFNRQISTPEGLTEFINNVMKPNQWKD